VSAQFTAAWQVRRDLGDLARPATCPQLLAGQRKFAEDLLKVAATETYKPGQIVPRDGPSSARGTTTSKTTSKPVPDSHRALITMSIARALPGDTSRA